MSGIEIESVIGTFFLALFTYRLACYFIGLGGPIELKVNVNLVGDLDIEPVEVSYHHHNAEQEE